MMYEMIYETKAKMFLVFRDERNLPIIISNHYLPLLIIIIIIFCIWRSKNKKMVSRD